MEKTGKKISKQKKVFRIILAVIIILYVLQLFFIPYISPAFVTSIEIRNGNTGDFVKITDQQTIASLISDINHTTVVPYKCSMFYMGYYYDIQIIGKGPLFLNRWRHFILQSDGTTIRKDPFFYHIKNTGITIDTINALFDQ